ncbi:MAG TPA: aminotransferase class I/II-fold pyridoxal phosphate-dependent enzyme [Thermoanaerobaculia bacterium]|nr:aminotransferase class I/II-fold pyridoxal phosphate-dependent enzyme [Thermoanaerobaculia bacterium]
MRDTAEEINVPLERQAPALFRALSPLGKRVFFASRIPGGPPSGSPVEGLPEVRERWREWQRRSAPAGVPSSLPLVTAGLSHGLSLIADLFGGEGKAVAVPSPFWGNYRQAFAVRTGAKVLTGEAYVDGRYNPRVISDALAGLPEGEPAVAILNIPSNPGGYSPDPAERRATVESLLEEAGRRPLVVVCDDAYAGLVFEPDIPRESLFWELAGAAHPNLAAVKVDGATKEFSFFGGRVGFLTFALEPESEAARSLESKVKTLVRCTIGSPVTASQEILLHALRTEGVEAEIEDVRRLLEGRYRSLRGALAGADPGLMGTLPFNSGCFALVELPEGLGLDSETVRRHLLERHDTGLISLAPRYLRIAHCSVDEGALPELVRRMEKGIGELAT